MARITGDLVPVIFGNAPVYQIQKSLRFNSADASYLSRTPGVAGNRKTWTWSGWVKRSRIGAGGVVDPLFGVTSGSYPAIFISFSNDTLNLEEYSGGYSYEFYSTPVYRDPSAWYHIVIAFDSTQATDSNRVKMYVNNQLITSWSAGPVWPSLNFDSLMNSTTQHFVGRSIWSDKFFNGYMSDVYLIDGQQLTPSSFGQFSSVTGQWTPKPYTGTYGTCGCKLTFADNFSTTALGYDTSGVGNNWTTSGFSVTAGVTNDSYSDTPTNNFCTLNPLSNGGMSLSNGALYASSAAAYQFAFSTFKMTTGKWYHEVTVSGGNYAYTGVSFVLTSSFGDSSWDAAQLTSYNYVASGTTADRYQPSNGGAWSSGDVIGVCVDVDAGKVWFTRNGTQLNDSGGVVGNPALGTNPNWTVSMPDGVFAHVAGDSGKSFNANFGQRAFTYTPPTGFKSLCTANLPTPSIVKSNTQFDTVLWTGNGTSQSPTLQFQPDLVWVKSRSVYADHKLTDSVRGATKALVSNSSGTETTDTNGLTAFNSNGFSIGSDTVYNNNGTTYVGWAWKKGATPGFDIVTFTGTGANLDVSHGLGVIPAFISIKGRDGTPPQHWWTWHKSLAAYDSALVLNLTNAVANGQWNNIRAASSSTQFFLGTDTQVNRVGWQYAAYLWSEVPGFSKFGSYIGNGSADGPFVFTGMRLRYVMVKRVDSADDWVVIDTARDPYNPGPHVLYPDGTYSEDNHVSPYPIDLLSNGFKWRNSYARFNASGGTYIFAAFAESPFKYSLAR